MLYIASNYIINMNDEIEIMWRKEQVLLQNLSGGNVQNQEEPNPIILTSIPGLLVDMYLFFFTGATTLCGS
jgi:hypothetical protein